MKNNIDQIVGQAVYIGKKRGIILEFGSRETQLYNCEGFYVRDSQGKQIICDGNWKLLLDHIQSDSK